MLLHILICLPCDTAWSQTCSIAITVKGINNNKGKIVLYLYNSATGYPGDHRKAFQTVSNTISNNQCSIVLNDIPVGIYAIAYFHDENNNGKMDTNFLGIPSEGVGASNNAKGFMGPPKFSDAKFKVDSNLSMNLSITNR